jgi:hypothetical protein
MRQLLRALAPGALERLDAFGRDDRRESAVAVLLAGGAPMAGLLLLDWDPTSVLLALFLNLLTIVVEDLVKIRLSLARRRAEVLREAVEDEYVWLVARALADGLDRVSAKDLPTEKRLENGEGGDASWFAASLAFATSGFGLFMLLGDGSVYAHPVRFAYATAPNLLLVVVMAGFHRWNQHPHWRRAGSVRLQTCWQTALAVFMLGMTLAGALAPGRGRPAEESTVALLLCVATLAYGLFCAWRLWTLGNAAYWLRSWAFGSGFRDRVAMRSTGRRGQRGS